MLRMMAHTATADAFADTEHNKNQDDQTKTCIAYTAFANHEQQGQPRVGGEAQATAWTRNLHPELLQICLRSSEPYKHGEEG